MAAAPDRLNRLPIAKTRDYAGWMPASSHSRSDLGLRIRVAPEEVEYWHWPLKDSGPSSWVTLAIVVVTPIAMGWLSESLAVCFLTLACLMLASWRTWLPIGVVVGASGVTQTVLGRRQRIPWTAIRHYEIGQHGVLMLPDEFRNQFSPLRGIYLHWGRHRAEVLANFEYYLQSWSAGRDPGNESTNLMQPAP